jgi:vacuolar-type H+-ATPase subunit I/STV1
MLRDKGQMYSGRVWIPRHSQGAVIDCINKLAATRPNLGKGYLEEIKDWGSKTPPSYFELNDFTYPA